MEGEVPSKIFIFFLLLRPSVYGEDGVSGWVDLALENKSCL